MAWDVEFHPAFEAEFDQYEEDVQDAILARALLLKEFGPQLGRPYCDTLKASKHTNMKELRCDVDGGIWRIAFAFDPQRMAMLLSAGDKGGANEKRFYKQLIRLADQRFAEHLEELKDANK